MDNVVAPPSSTISFDWIFFILAGNKVNYKSLDGFKIWQVRPANVELAALERRKSPLRLIMGELL